MARKLEKSKAMRRRVLVEDASRCAVTALRDLGKQVSTPEFSDGTCKAAGCYNLLIRLRVVINNR